MFLRRSMKSSRVGRGIIIARKSTRFSSVRRTYEVLNCAFIVVSSIIRRFAKNTTDGCYGTINNSNNNRVYLLSCAVRLGVIHKFKKIVFQVPSSGLNSPRNFAANAASPAPAANVVPPYQTPPQACPLSLSITNSYITPSTSQHPVLSHAASNYIPKSSSQQPPPPHQHGSPYAMQKPPPPPPPNVMYHPPHGAPYPSPVGGYHPGPYKSAPPSSSSSSSSSSLLAAVSSSYMPYPAPQSSSTVTVSASATIPSTSSGQVAATATPQPTNFNSPYQQSAVHPQHHPPLYAPYRSTPYMPSALSIVAVSITYLVISRYKT